MVLENCDFGLQTWPFVRIKKEKLARVPRNYEKVFFQLHHAIQTLAEKDNKANNACKDIEERKANYQLLNGELTNEKVSAFNCWFFVWESLIKSMSTHGFNLANIFFSRYPYLFKRRPLKIVKHTQTIRRQQPTNCLSVFDHFLGLMLEGLICSFFDAFKVAVIFFVEIASIKLYKVVNSVLQNDGR